VIRRSAFLVAAVVAAVVVPAVGATADVGSRAYDAAALAVPVNPQAGSHDSPIPVRLFPTRADVSNPPTGASGRAARTDLGLLEQFVPPQALGPAADASTRDRNSGRNARTTDGSAVYTAHADQSPAANATATAVDVTSAGVSIGHLRSTSSTHATGATVVAEAVTTMTQLAFGPVDIGSASYHAAAVSTGRSHGAHASGRVTVTDATVAGVPVVVTQDGVQVDTTKVEADQVDSAAAAVAAAFAQVGYFDVRLVQPTATAKPDGSAAAVHGGGLQVIGRSDSQNSYFLELTLLSGDVDVAFGGPLDLLGGFDELGVGHLPTGVNPPGAGRLGPPFLPPTAPRGRAGGLPPVAAPEPTPLPIVATSDARLPGVWRDWWVLLAIASGLVAAGGGLWLPVAAPARRRVGAMVSTAADRYVRG
jgi:hypothetical protein